jgi:hypothetical protein
MDIAGFRGECGIDPPERIVRPVYDRLDPQEEISG